VVYMDCLYTLFSMNATDNTFLHTVNFAVAAHEGATVGVPHTLKGRNGWGGFHSLGEEPRLLLLWYVGMGYGEERYK